MKTLFIEAKTKVDISHLIDKLKLPNKIGLVSAVQFLDNLNDVKKYIESKGKKAVIAGQVLGCNMTNPLMVKEDIDAYLFIGSRGFHPVEIARITKKPVFIANPITNETSQITKKEVEEIENRKKGRILNYLHSNKVGILVTLKPGQENIDLAFILKERLDKESYIFVGNEMGENDLINFSDIGSWVNTACSRIEINKVVNFDEIANYIKNTQILTNE